jgi:hypothetical protein
MGADPPRVSNGANLREIIISHREYIGDVVTGGVGAFASSSFMLNPGNGAIFPWLSYIASAFQQYKFRGIVFEFKSMSADALNSTNTALGNVIMASNYNVLQRNFANKSEMENTEFSSSCKPSSSMYHPIECDPNDTVLNELYIAPNGEIPDGGTPQFYDFCNFQIATNGFQAANVNIGELWVTYEIALLKPIQPSIAGVAPIMIYQENSFISIPTYTTTTNVALSGGLVTYATQSIATTPVIVSDHTFDPTVTTASQTRNYVLNNIEQKFVVGTKIRLFSWCQINGAGVVTISQSTAVSNTVDIALTNTAGTIQPTTGNATNAITGTFAAAIAQGSVVYTADLIVTGMNPSFSLTPALMSHGATSAITASSQMWMHVLPPGYPE